MTGKPEYSSHSEARSHSSTISSCTTCGATDGTEALWLCHDDGCLFRAQWATLADSEREHVLAHGIAAP